MEFPSLPLPAPVLQGIDAAGFTTCTPIQEKVLPLSLAGRDVAGQAQTGTGKTAAFLITIFTRLLAHHGRDAHAGGPRAFVVAPTRELALQILHDAEALGSFTGLRSLAVYGGVDYGKQRDDLRAGCDILIGTPGRLIDYFKQHVYTLRHVQVLVIDEADRMFDMGFIADLRYLLRRMPPYDKRQSMLFSATLSWDVMELAYEHMNDPVKVSITPERIAADNIEHVLYHVGMHEKFPLLLGLMQHEKPTRTLIFVNTKREAEYLERRLQDHDLQAAALTGDVDQRVRMRLVRQFKAGTLPILVATDVASRGLHVEGVSHVINYDLPQDAENYVHRIGRTARAGASGKAISLACERFVMSLEDIETLVGFKLPSLHVVDELLVKPIPAAHRRPAVRRSPREPERKHETHAKHETRAKDARHEPRAKEAKHEPRAKDAPAGRRRRRRRRRSGTAPAATAATE